MLGHGGAGTTLARAGLVKLMDAFPDTEGVVRDERN